MDLETERVARRVGLELDLERYAARAVLLQDQLNRAQATMAAAQAKLSRAQRAYTGNETECANIRRLLAFDPAVVNTLPVELLQTIWTHLSDITSARGRCTSIADEEYSAARALLPGRLAAVCRHWRHVALNTPELWTYIALPHTCESRLAPLLLYVDFQLQRLQQVGLELILGCDGQSAEELTDTAAATRASSIMELLRVASCRAYLWRSVRIRLPGTSADAFARVMAGVETPMLEELFLATADSDELDLQFVASSPHLRMLCLPTVRIRLVLSSPLSSLTSATLTVFGTRQGQLWDLIRALPYLRHLHLCLDQPYLEVTAGAGITAGSLEALTLRGDFLVLERLLTGNVAAPRLKRLNITTGMVGRDHAWGADFFATYPRITELELVATGGLLTQQGLDALNGMKQVQRVTLIEFLLGAQCPFQARCLFVALDTHGDVPSGQTSRLPADIQLGASEEDPMPDHHSGLVWPELEQVTLIRTRGCDDDLFNQLLSFSRTRTLFNEGRGKPFQLALLESPDPFPPWFRHAVGYLFGPTGVVLTTADGTSYAPVGNDGWDTEQEAESSGAEDSDSVSASLFNMEREAGSSEESEPWGGSVSSEDSEESGESG